MTDPSHKIPLPHSIEQLLSLICSTRDLPPPEDNARRVLSSISEDEALGVLQQINNSKTAIKTLSGFIVYMINKRKSQSTIGSPHRSSPSYASPSKGCNSPVASMPRDNAVTRSPVSYQASSSMHASMGASYKQVHSPQLLALGELEFRKQFLVLSYIGRCRLEDVLSVDEIRRMKYHCMEKFEDELWRYLYYEKGVRVEERRKTIDWDSGKTHLYECHVSIDGSYRLKGPYLHKLRTHLQRVLGDDNVLNVKFEDASEMKGSLDSYTEYWKIGKEGIRIGLRVYRFFVMKDGGRERKKSPTTSSVKCMFVRTESSASIDENGTYILSGRDMKEARAVFMHVHTTLPNISKYMARFGLILSKTIKLEIDDENMENVNVKIKDDIYCRDLNNNVVFDEDGKKRIHTDGTGFISKDLAMMVPNNLFKGEHMHRRNLEKFPITLDHTTMDMPGYNVEPPLLIQMRLFYRGYAAKGTLLINNTLKGRTIVLRKSMVKVDPDEKISYIPTKNSLEVVSTSNKPRRTYLSRNLIALLSFGGVPENYFMSVLNDALEDFQNIFSSLRAAYRASIRHGEIDEFTASSMILCGIPLDESYLQYRLAGIMKDDMKDLKGGKLPISESYYLMGTADPTGKLKNDEVCVILENGQISGNVLVYRNPGLHFGDIHVLKAVYVNALESIVGNAKYAVFFPCKGPRSLTDEFAGGDLDGDMYWVSRNHELLKHFKESARWVPEPPLCSSAFELPNQGLPRNFEDELFRLFLTTRFQPSYAMGVAADSWLALIDRFLTLGNDCLDEKKVLKDNIIKLINVYYEALDAPKKGVKVEVPKELQATMFPHYMDKKSERLFKSSSVLGKIFDKVEAFEVKDPLLTEVRKLPCFETYDPPSSVWMERYENYKREMSAAMNLNEEIKNFNANSVIQKYKQMLYGAAELEVSPRNIQEILDEALSIYNVCYDYAINEGNARLCGFAWRVAGPALCMLYVKKQGEKWIPCAPSVLKEI